MPKFTPIDVVRYATPEGGRGAGGMDISRKIAPPYDVLDEQRKAELISGDHHNIVAIDLPVTPPKTVGPDAAYDAAGRTYRQWLSEGVLQRDAKPAVVAYEQVYRVEGRRQRRRGLFAGLGVEPFNRKDGGIHRHEMTIAGGIGDRTRLMEATRAQLSPIFGVFSDPQARVVNLLEHHFDGRPPDFSGVTANDAVTHNAWLVDDAQTLSQLERFFEPTDVFIADGHHRYTTALDFSHAHPELPGAATCLFVLVAAEDPGMIVLPTHRVLCGLKDFSIDRLVEALGQHGGHFVFTEMAHDARFGLYDPESGNTFGINSTADDPLGAIYPDKPEVWRTLDVTVLHELLIDRVLRPAFGEAITYQYTADPRQMERWAGAKPGRVGLVMGPTPLASVMGVSLADEVMPPKSTYFYPKLATGLVINPLD